MDKKVKIDIHEWVNIGESYYLHGTFITVNGTRLVGEDNDYETILTKVLEHLGYEVELNVETDKEF